MDTAESKSLKKAAIVRAGQSAINCLHALATLRESENHGAGLAMTPQRLGQYVMDLSAALTGLAESLPVVEDTLNQASKVGLGGVALTSDNAVQVIFRLGRKLWGELGSRMRTPQTFTAEDVDVGLYEKDVDYAKALRQVLTDSARRVTDPETLEAQVRNEVELAISIIENAD